MSAETVGHGTESTPSSICAADYQRMIRQFDQLWSSATSEQDQKEMQRLIAFIELYETERKTQQRNKDLPVPTRPEIRIPT
jgi:hypothetical protein